MDEESSLYKSAMFLPIQKGSVRSKTILSENFRDNLKWSAGFAINNFNVSSVDIDKLNKAKKKRKSCHRFR
jgi:hypothetical protein